MMPTLCAKLERLEKEQVILTEFHVKFLSGFATDLKKEKQKERENPEIQFIHFNFSMVSNITICYFLREKH